MPRPFKLAHGAMALALMTAFPAQAGILTWVGATGDWATASNWTGAGSGPPGASDTANIINALSAAQIQAINAQALSINVQGGHLVVNGATTTLAVGGNLSLVNAGTMAVTGGAGVTGTDRFFLDSASTLSVDGSGSVVQVQGDVIVGNGSSGTATLSNGGLLRSVTTGVVLGNGGGTTGVLNIGNGAGAGILDARSVTTVLGSGTLNFNHTDTNYFFTRDGTSTGGAINISGNIAVTVNGGGVTTLTGNDTYSGATNVNNGTLRAGAAGAFSSSSATTVASGATLDMNNTNQTIASLAGSGTVQLGSGTLTTGGDNSSTTFSGNISGTGGLTKAGSGTFTLSGANSYSGATTVSSGTLQASASNAFSSNSAVTVASGATLDLNNISQTVGSLAGSGTVQLGSGTLTTGDNNSSTTFSGNISGAGGLTKAGTGTFTLSGTISGVGTSVTVNGGTVILAGSNTYTAGTFVNTGGTLQISSMANLGGTSSVYMFGGKLVVSEDMTMTGNLNFQNAASDTIAAAAGKTLSLGGNYSFSQNTALIFGDTTNTGTVALNSSTINNPFSFGLNSTTLEVAGGTLTGSSLNDFTSNAGSTTVQGGARLDLAGQDISVNKLLGSGTVSTGTSTTITLTLGDNSAFSGVINGSGNLATVANATVTLSGANAYSGTTNVASGSTLNVTGGGQLGAGGVTIAGTLGVDKSADYTLAGALSGSGVLNKTGTGKLILSGSSTSFAGTTNVNGGTLAVNGTLSGTLNVNSGGVLGGSGTAGDVNVLAGGVLAPGNSIGTLTVNGNLTFNSGSIYRVEADAAGNADKTVVNGALTIAGTLDVQAGSGTYVRNTSYTILTNTGTQTGSFATVTSNLAFLAPTVTYNTNSVVLNLARNDASYSSVGGSNNQVIIGQYLDRYGSGSLANLINQIDNLSAGGARNAFDSLSGSQHAAGSQVAQGIGRAFAQGLAGHLSNGGVGGTGSAATGLLNGGGNAVSGSLPWGPAVDAPAQLAGLFSGAAAAASAISSTDTGGGATYKRSGRRDTGIAASGDSGSLWGRNPNASGGLWGQALGGGGHTDSNGNGAGSNYRSGGFIAGADYALSPHWLIGVAGGYQRANWDANTNGNAPASGKVETPMGAVYARYSSGPWMIAATGSYADNKFTTNRSVTIGTTTSTASSTHSGGEWGASLQAELALAAGAWEVRPLAGLRYARLKEDAFSEIGAGAANLSVDARTSSNTTLSAGVKGVRRFGTTGREGALELRVIASHLYGDNDAPVSARLAGQSASFTSNGTPLKRDAVTIGAGVSKRIGKRLSGFADLSYEDRGSGQNAYALSAGLRYTW